MKRLVLLISSLLIVAGLVLYAQGGRIFVTFLLDLVVGTISSTPAEPLPPHSFSWGVKHWGNMNEELARSCWGLLVVALGQLALLPAVVPRAAGKVKLGLILSFGLMMMAGFVGIGSALGTIGAFSTLAETGVADPVGLGESLPVRQAGLGKLFFIGGQGLLVVIGFATAFRKPEKDPGTSGVRFILSGMSAAGILTFAGCLMLVGFGPLTEVLALTPSPSTGVVMADPAVLAQQISNAFRAMLFGHVVLMFASILGLVAAILPAPRATLPADEAHPA